MVSQNMPCECGSEYMKSNCPDCNNLAQESEYKKPKCSIKDCNEEMIDYICGQPTCAKHFKEIWDMIDKKIKGEK